MERSIYVSSNPLYHTSCGEFFFFFFVHSLPQNEHFYTQGYTLMKHFSITLKLQLLVSGTNLAQSACTCPAACSQMMVEEHVRCSPDCSMSPVCSRRYSLCQQKNTKKWLSGTVEQGGGYSVGIAVCLNMQKESERSCYHHYTLKS